jgi:hypothetical protein
MFQDSLQVQGSVPDYVRPELAATAAPFVPWPAPVRHEEVQASIQALHVSSESFLFAAEFTVALSSVDRLLHVGSPVYPAASSAVKSSLAEGIRFWLAPSAALCKSIVDTLILHEQHMVLTQIERGHIYCCFQCLDQGVSLVERIPQGIHDAAALSARSAAGALATFTGDVSCKG